MGDGGLGGEDEGAEVGEGGGAEGGGGDEDVEDAEVHEIKIEVRAGKGVDLKKDLPVFIGWIPGGHSRWSGRAKSAWSSSFSGS